MQLVKILPEDLLASAELRAAPVVLDVRSRAEFVRGHVPGAVHVPFWRLWLSAHDVPATPTDPVVVYCGHGPRARIAAAALRRHGFRHISCLAGHMTGWRKKRLPIERGGESR
jgi:rhodanese-related sulfurtransferase